MLDEDKTKEQLIGELKELRRRLEKYEDPGFEDNRLRRAVEVSEEAFRSLYHKSLDVLLIVDDESGEIIEVNQTTQSILGYAEGDLVGEHFSILFLPDAELSVKEDFEKIKNYGTVFVQEFRRKDGSGVVMDLTATMLPWHGDSAILATMRDVTERVEAEREREKLISELQAALDKIKTLKGLLPICAHCKKVLNEEGDWQQVESYVTEHSKADFTHGLCPDCAQEHYSEFLNK